MFHRRLAFLTMVVFSAAPAARGDDGFFEKKIRPVLVTQCYACHSAAAGRTEGGLSVDSAQALRDGGGRGYGISPESPQQSVVLAVLAGTLLDDIPEHQVSAEIQADFERWVKQGAPDPRDADPQPAGPRRTNPADPVAGRSHWAFAPLVRPQVPPVAKDAWSPTRIDRFIFERLSAAGLRPSSDADRRTLVRRVYFDLIGLPPTPGQIDAFVADDRPDALPRLVDRLLDSPQFGERWGRHWLDLARYADSNGLDENFLFREAWRYRNWVIDAINADTPFDRFLREQIAGDLLPFESVEQRDRQRIGSGFLVVGPKVLLGIKDERQRMDIADEQLDTVGRAVLGMTMGCARCHDHKFDPIPTADYYAMAGIFTSTQVMEQRYMLNQQRRMEQLIGLGPEGETLDDAYEEYWRKRGQWAKQVSEAKAALEFLRTADHVALAALKIREPGVIHEEAADSGRPPEERIAAQRARVAELEARVAKVPPIPPRAMACADVPRPDDEHIRLAGQFDKPGDKVPRGFLQVISDEARPAIPAGQSGRLELARWLTDVEHGAGRLAARVLANRIWHHLLGRGIVGTVDNFGRTGEMPTHPQLLDDLACDLIESGWSIKSLVRQVILSRTYGMSSDYDSTGYAADPDNHLLWRANRRRLPPEAVRDAMLMAADGLDLAPMGSTVWYLGDQATAVGKNEIRRRTDFPCRSVYLPVIRNDLPELFEVFDFADPHTTTGARPRTNVAMQGLFMLNSELVMSAAEATARRLLAEASTDAAERVDLLYRWIVQTTPSEVERRAMLDYIEESKARFATQGEPHDEVLAWAAACHALFASSRFQYLE
jgi:hypothetical protein